MSEEAKWSPEPWQSNLDDRGDVFDVNGDYVVAGDDYAVVWQHRNDTPGNKRRAIACVNACAGIPTEALEAGALGKALDLTACPLPDDAAEVDEILAGLVAALRALGRL